jgi:hypothetical protein
MINRLLYKNKSVEEGEFKYCRNFCKCHNVPPPSTTIKINNKKWKQRDQLALIALVTDDNI